MAEKKKYTFRFHTHGWTDITVEAENEEEAQMLADDKYNEGDYDDSDTLIAVRANGFELSLFGIA